MGKLLFSQKYVLWKYICSVTENMYLIFIQEIISANIKNKGKFFYISKYFHLKRYILCSVLYTSVLQKIKTLFDF